MFLYWHRAIGSLPIRHGPHDKWNDRYQSEASVCLGQLPSLLKEVYEACFLAILLTYRSLKAGIKELVVKQYHTQHYQGWKLLLSCCSTCLTVQFSTHGPRWLVEVKMSHLNSRE